ncbi:MAG: flagellar hook-basal body complex protein FliE [Ahrensia sp.]|nr:flagellar hook-basal body complex protein FliE [Ahrensia sp.]
MIDAVSGLAVPTNALSQTSLPSLSQQGGPTVTDGSFAEMVSGSAQALMASLQNAETMSAAGMTGQAGVREVTDAVMSAERDLQTTIAIRDKVVSAWLDVSRMAI